MTKARKGGKTRRGGSRKRKGGLLAQFQRALAPYLLFQAVRMQQKKKKGGGKKTRRGGRKSRRGGSKKVGVAKNAKSIARMHMKMI